MWKRRKLPATIIVSAIDQTRIAIQPKRLSSLQHDALVQSFSADKKRHRRYEIASQQQGAVQAWCVENDIKYSGIPMPVHLLRAGIPPEPWLEDQCGPVWQSLYPYQKEGVQRIITHYRGRGLLADDMGLGKTRQGVAFLSYYDNVGTRTLILCPSYLRFHWAHEVQTHLGIEAAVLRTKKKIHVLGESRVNIVSYDMLAGINLTPYDVILADESH